MGTERESRDGLAGTESVPVAPHKAYKLSRRERRELARRFRKLLEDDARARRPGWSPRTLRGQLGAVGAALAVLVASSADPQTAEAAVTASVSSGTLTVTSDGGDSIVVSCSAGSVKVNGSDPTPATACSDISAMSITGGPGNNDVNLTGVTVFAGFVHSVPAAPTTTVVGDAGDDTLRGSSFKDTLTGGTGNDSLVGGAETDVVSETGDDNTVTITNTQLQGSPTGLGTDTLSGLEGVAVGTGAGTGNNVFDASTFSTGRVTLSGGDGNDSLSGSVVSSDTTIASSGNDSLDGGNGTDRLVQSFNDSTVTLTPASLTGGTAAGALGTDTLSNVEEAALTGQGAANTINAGTFAGAVTLDGAGGNDTLTGGTASDSLTGGAGNDSITGGTGADTFVGADGNDTFAAGGTDGDRLVESGDDSLVTLSDTALTGGSALGTDTISGTLEFVSISGGAAANNIGASGFTMGPVTLKGDLGNDTLGGATHAAAGDSLDGEGGTDRLVQPAIADATVTLTNTQLQGPALGTDTLANLEEASLAGATAGTVANAFDASAFSAGPVSLSGGGGDDSLTGAGANASNLSGGTGNDTLTGGTASDVVTETANDASVVLTNSSLVGATTAAGLGTDSLSGIDHANLTGGAAANNLDASGFTAGSVTLSGLGDSDTLSGAKQGAGGADSLDGGPGTGVLDVLTHTNVTDPSIVLTSTSLAGAATAGGLGTDSLVSFERVTLTGASGDNLIDASEFFTGNVSLAGGDGNDTVKGGGGTDTVEGGLADDVVDGGSGTTADSVDGGTGTDTLQGTASASGGLTLTGNSTAGALAGDLGTDGLAGIEKASLTGGASNNVLNASGFTGEVTLVGLAGDDELTGATVADSLIGGDGKDLVSAGDGADRVSGGNDNDTLAGGPGTDRLVEAGDDPTITLASTSLTGATGASGLGTDTLNDFQQADISGGAGPNTITVASFSGTVTLSGAGGADSLMGGAGPGAVSLNGGDASDTLKGGTGNVGDTLVGGSATDRVVASADTNFTLDNGQLSSPTLGSDAIGDVEEVSLTGGAGANSLDASGYTVGSVTLDGAGGSDTLSGGAGNDSLIGGPGNTADAVSGGPGIDLASAPLGAATDNATLAGTTAAATLSGGLGTDPLSGVEQVNIAGSTGVNTIDASGFSGATTLSGDADNDTVLGGSGADSVLGDAGTDVVSGGPGPSVDIVAGGAESDTLKETLGATDSVTLTGAAAAPTLSGGLGADQLSDLEQASLTGGSGDNTIDAQGFTGGPAQMDGQGGNDALIGTPAAETIVGGAADDTITGSAGGDNLDGGAGTGDRLKETFSGNTTLTNTSFNGNGADTLVSASFESASLTGGSGSDTLTATAFTGGPVSADGQGEADSLIGTAGADTLSGGTGTSADTLTGASGDDSLTGGDGTDLLSEQSDINFTLTDTQLTGSSTDTLDGIETAKLTGGVSANTLDASAFTGQTTLAGAGEADTLKGGSAADSISGDAGDDSLDGGGGADAFNGGVGADSLFTQDGVVESAIACGADTDTATVDTDDTTAADCETVNRPTPPPPPDTDGDGIVDAQDCAPADAARPAKNGTDANCDGVVDSTPATTTTTTPTPTPTPEPQSPAPAPTPPDTTPPNIGVSIPSTTAAGLVSIIVSCPSTEPRGCTGTVTARSAAPVRVSRRMILNLGSASYRLGAGQRKKINIRLSRRNRAILARLRRMRVRLTVIGRDSAGNKTTRRRTVTLVAPKRPARRR